MARRASGSKVSYKELDSDGDDGMAPWGLSDDDDDDADLKALKAAAPLAKKRKKAGRKAVGDTYGARRPQRKKPKRTKAPLPVETSENCQSDAAQKDLDDGNPFKRAVGDDYDESDSERKASSNKPDVAATESNAAGKVEVAGFSGELLLKLPFEMFAEICSHFKLRDLVRIAKTSKKLHEILLARNARSIWSRCRERTGYILPTDMSELQFALFIAGESCQHCGSACDTYVAFLFTWMVRFCCGCRHSQLAPRRSLGKSVGRLHSSTLTCVRFQNEFHDSKWDDFLVSEVTEVNNTLVRLQTQDDAARAMLAKRSLWTTRSRRTEMQDEDSLRTDNVARYLSARKTFLDRRVEESAQVEENYRSIQRREEAEMARIAKETKRQLKERVEVTVKQLRDSHGWTSEDTAKLQKGLIADYVRYPYSLAPKTLPDDDRDGWTAFQVKYRARIDKEAEWARENERSRQRQKLLEQTYATVARSLEAELMFVPSWTVVSYQRPVTTFLQAKPTPGQDEVSHDPEVLRTTLLTAAEQHVQRERLEAIRDIVAAHLDIPVNQLSKKEDDYPTDIYNEAFFQKIPNRFAVTSGQPRTFRQLKECNNASPWRLNIRRNLPQWRRATRHVLLTAGKETSSDLDEVNALGKSFAWQNGPEAIKTQRYTWSVMVETIINQGPRGLRLSDLKDIDIIYTPIKGKGEEKDLDTSGDGGNPLRRKKIMDDSEDDSEDDSSSRRQLERRQ